MNIIRNSSIWVLVGEKDVEALFMNQIVQKKPDTIEVVIDKIVERVFGYPVEYLRCVSKKRHDEYKLPRQTHLSLLVFAGYSLSKAGKVYEKDHATVLWTKQKIENILSTQYPINEYKLVKRAISEFENYVLDCRMHNVPGSWNSIIDRIPGAYKGIRNVTANVPNMQGQSCSEPNYNLN